MNIHIGEFGDKVGPVQLLHDAAAKHHDAKAVVVVVLDRDDSVGVGYTDMENLQILGMLDIAKDSIIRSMED